MAGRRVYITIPEEDHELLGHWAMLNGECRSMLCRRIVLTSLYHALSTIDELKDYEQSIQLRRRERMVSHGR